MNYRVIRDCMVNGEKARSGDVLVISDALAKQLMAIGRIIPDSASTKTEEPINIEDRQVKRTVRRAKTKTASE